LCPSAGSSKLGIVNGNRIKYPWPYVIVFVLAALAFIIPKLLFGTFPGSFVIKAVPATSLALAVLLHPARKAASHWWLLIGVVLCGVGDVILDIDRVRLFVPGLAAFLLGHSAFIGLFWLRRKMPGRRAWGVVPVLAVAAAMAVVLIPRLDRMMVPVLAYLLVITVMTTLAVFSELRGLVAVGAGVFMLSDALLALAKFVFDGQPSPAITISVYFVGFGLLGFACLTSSRFVRERASSSGA
jgi:uncharacterized membrane protein YhhN